jgi:hypothetical protein
MSLIKEVSIDEIWYEKTEFETKNIRANESQTTIDPSYWFKNATWIRMGPESEEIWIQQGLSAYVF